tara:strand:+ start:30229 stop:30330 length:102 start_codon:yes stop_codon:yes gene_type:complete
METAPRKNDSVIITEKSMRIEEEENDSSWDENT